MTKFIDHYTTKEQSERLLKLGIPNWSADMHYPSSTSEYPVITAHAYGHAPNADSTSCWSTGRLIEIFNICNCYGDLVQLIEIPEEIIKEIDTSIMAEEWNMDKLDGYKYEN